jgi:hypothetical protein
MVEDACTYFISQKVSLKLLKKSIPAQIRQVILYISDNKGQVDGFVRKLTFAKRLHTHFLCDATRDSVERNTARQLARGIPFSHSYRYFS